MKVNMLDHIHIYSATPSASVAFYETHFEATRSGTMKNIRGATRHFLRLGGAVIVLSPFPPGIEPTLPSNAAEGAYPTGFGVAHIGLNVDDVEAAVEELRAAGVEVLGEVKRSTGLTYAFVAAPDGVVIELTQYG